MSDVLKANRFQTVTLWIFAAVGFLASIVALYGFLSPDTAQLQIRTYAQTVKIPRAIAEPFMNEGDDLATFAEVLEQNGCPPKAEKPNDHICGHAKQMLQVREDLGKLNYPVSAFYDMEIKNTGDAVARDIRLDGSSVAFIMQTV